MNSISYIVATICILSMSIYYFVIIDQLSISHDEMQHRLTFSYHKILEEQYITISKFSVIALLITYVLKQLNIKLLTWICEFHVWLISFSQLVYIVVLLFQSCLGFYGTSWPYDKQIFIAIAQNVVIVISVICLNFTLNNSYTTLPLTTETKKSRNKKLIK